MSANHEQQHRKFNRDAATAASGLSKQAKDVQQAWNARKTKLVETGAVYLNTVSPYYKGPWEKLTAKYSNQLRTAVSAIEAVEQTGREILSLNGSLDIRPLDPLSHESIDDRIERLEREASELRIARFTAQMQVLQD